MKNYRLVSLGNDPSHHIQANSDEEAVEKAVALKRAVNVFSLNAEHAWILLAQIYPNQPKAERVYWMSGKNLDRKILAQFRADTQE